MTNNPEIDANSFAGTWRLAEAYAETAEGRRPFPLGEGALGSIMYDTAGHMSAQLMGADRKPFSSRNLDEVPLQEFKDTYLGYTSYYGTYTLNVAEKTVTHHVQGALTAAWVGGDQLRYFEFNDGALVLKTPPMRTADGTKVVNTLVWRRA
jgi:hypothetical protein